MTLAEALATPTNREWHVRYVLHGDVARFQSIGWVVLPGLKDTHHGHYSELMEWKGDGEPKEPSHG